MKERTDEELVRLVVASDDRAAFAELIARHQRGVFGLLYRMLGRQHEDVEDVAQNVFIAVYRGLGAFKGGSKFSTWLFRVTYNHACSALRRRQSKRETSLDAGTADDPDAQHEIADADSPDPERAVLHAQVWAAVERLPAQSRAVIELYYGQGQNYPEIADVLGLPLGTVKTHLFRARAKLRELLTAPAPAEVGEHA